MDGSGIITDDVFAAGLIAFAGDHVHGCLCRACLERVSAAGDDSESGDQSSSVVSEPLSSPEIDPTVAATGPVGVALSSLRPIVNESQLSSFAAGLTRGNILPTNTVSYSFLGLGSAGFWSRFSDVDGPYAWSNTEKAQIRLALAQVSNVANLNFVESSDNNLNAAFTFEHFFHNSGLVGISGFPGTSTAGHMGLNIRFLGSEMRLDQSSFGFSVTLHEIGHALGLKHTHDNGGTGAPTFGELGFNVYDKQAYTVMSYNDPYPSTTGFAGNLGILDIYTLHRLYGARAANTGDDVYRSRSYQQTIWDTGGTDTIDMSAGGGLLSTEGTVIDLREGALSYGRFEHSTAALFGIAFGAVVENAVGTRNADTIIGNAADNVLDGGINNGAFSDRLVGGAGNDTYIVDAGTNGQFDRVEENAGEGFDTVRTNVSGYIADANVEAVVFTGSGNADLSIGAGNLTGGAGDDVLSVAGSASLVSNLDGGDGIDMALIARKRSDFSFAIAVNGFSAETLLVAESGETAGAVQSAGGILAQPPPVAPSSEVNIVNLSAADGTEITLTDIEGRAFQDNSLFVSLGLGALNPTLIDFDGDGRGDTQLADINLDGIADRLFHGVGNDFWVSMGTGNGFAAAELILDFGGPTVTGGAHLITAGGSAALDLVFVDGAGHVWYSQSGDDWAVSPEVVEPPPNSAPVIGVSDLSGAVTELPDGAVGEGTATLGDSGTISFSDVDLTDAHTVSVTPQAGGYRGALTAAITNAATGDGSGVVTWSYNVADSALEDLAAGQSLTQLYDVTIDDGAGGMVTQTVTVFVTGTNDAPVFRIGTLGGSVTELPNGDANEGTATLSTAGFISFSDDDSVAHTVRVTPQGAGYLGSFDTTILNIPDTILGRVNWNFSVADSALENLAAGQSLTQLYDITIDDGSGGTLTRTATITLNGADDSNNRAPVVVTADEAGSVTELPDGATGEGTAILTDSGTISFTDLDLTDAHTVSVTHQGGGTLGTLAASITDAATGDGSGIVTWSYSVADSALEDLNSGQSLTQLYDITIDDGSGGSVTRALTISLNGADDAPAPVGNVAPILVLGTLGGSVTELPNGDANEGTATLSATGFISFRDDDSFAHTVSVTPQGNGYLGSFDTTILNIPDTVFGRVNWNFSVADSALENLAAGQSLTQRYDITINDGSGGTLTQTATITLNGADDSNNSAPVVVTADEAGSVTELPDGAAGEGTAILTDSGTISFTDVDLTDAHTVSVTPQAGGYRGALTASITNAATGDGAGAVTWTYNVADAALDNLADGQSLTQLYDVTIDDGNGGTVTRTVTVTLNGADDAVPNIAPTISISSGAEELYFAGSRAGAGVEIFKLSADGVTSQVTDINPGDGNAYPTQFAVFGDALYFQAREASFGAELYKVTKDGTVSLVSDIVAGPDDSRPGNLFAFGDSLYFSAWQVPLSQGANQELFRVRPDGEVELFAEIDPGTGWGGGSFPGGFTEFNGDLYFRADDGTSGANLFRLTSDGVIERAATSAPSTLFSVYDLTEFNGALYFRGIDSEIGQELFRYNIDGTIELVADILPGDEVLSNGITRPRSSAPTEIYAFNGSLYFQARGVDELFRGLWRLDSSGEITEVLANSGSLDQPKSFTEFNGELYFKASSSLYKITADGTVETVAGASPGAVAHLQLFDNALYFYDTSGMRRIEADGTITNVALGASPYHFGPNFTLFRSGAAQKSTDEDSPLTITGVSLSDPDAGSSPLTVGLSVVNGTLAFANASGLVFTDADGSDGRLSFSGTLSALNAAFAAGLVYTPDANFFGSDTLSISVDDGAGGTATATESITVVSDGIDEPVGGSNSAPVVGAADLSGAVTELPDGAAGEGTATLSDSGTISFSDVDLTDAHTVSVTPQAGGYRGTLTASVTNASTGDGAGAVTWTYNVADAALDNLADGQSLTQLYDVTIDDGNGGTVTRTVTVTLNGADDAAANVAPTISISGGATPDAELYFSAQIPESGVGTGSKFELFKMTADEEFIQVTDLYESGSFPSDITAFGDALYFRARDEFGKHDLFRVGADGIVTKPVDLNPGEADSPSGFTEFNGALYFTARGPETGTELYRVTSNGRVELVVDLNAGTGRGANGHFGLYDGSLYFAGDNGQSGGELFRIDANDSIELVADINSSGHSAPAWITEFNGELYFSADDGILGRELYKLNADGNVELVLDLHAGASDSYIHDLTVFNGSLYFSSGLSEQPREFWRLDSDGTLTEILDGVSSSYPRFTSWSLAGDKLFLGIGPAVYQINSNHEIENIIADSGEHGWSAVTELAGRKYVQSGDSFYRIETNGNISLVDKGNVEMHQFARFAKLEDSSGATGLTTDEDAAITITGISLADPDAGASPLTVDLSVAKGALSFADISGLSFTDADGSDGTLSFSGKLSALNAAFASGLVYTPDANFFGEDNLVIAVDDGAGGTVTATETITVVSDGIDESVGEPVIGTADLTGAVSEIADGAVGEGTATVSDSGAIEFSNVNFGASHTVSVAPNASGYRGALTASITDPAAGDGAGVVTWTYNVADAALDDLAAGAVVSELFTVTITDANGVSDQRTVAVQITGSNDAPILQADVFSTAADKAFTGNLFADNGNGIDSDPDGDTLAVTNIGIQATTLGGVVTVVSNGDFAYIPPVGLSGDDSFTYTVSDGNGGTATRTVSITVTSADEMLVGDGSDDILEGGSGDDTLDGGDGNDTLFGDENSIFDTAFGLHDALSEEAGVASAATPAGNDRLYGRAGDDRLFGGGGSDMLYGDTGLDTLDGGAGDDTLDGGTGDDTLDGGDGDDTASYAGDAGSVRANLLQGWAVDGSGGADRLWNIENITGSAQADHFYGSAGSNTLSGGDGNDMLQGGAGDDTLRGDAGNDFLDGGAGADTLDGGEGSDWADYRYAGEGVTADLSTGLGTGGEALGDRYSSIENLQGSGHGDRLTGNDDVNTFWAEGGDDEVHGLGGNDWISGGAGDDRLYGDGGSDVLNGGIGNDTLDGGSDVLNGGIGNDTLDGGSGGDLLNGGAGNDTYAIARGGGADIINNHRESSLDDTVLYGATVESGQLWFAAAGNDLVVRIIGTEDSVTVEDWFVGADNRVDFEVASGERLIAADVQNLVDAMVSFNPPAVGTTSLADAGFEDSALSTLAAAIGNAWK